MTDWAAGYNEGYTNALDDTVGIISSELAELSLNEDIESLVRYDTLLVVAQGLNKASDQIKSQ